MSYPINTFGVNPPFVTNDYVRNNVIGNPVFGNPITRNPVIINNACGILPGVRDPMVVENPLVINNTPIINNVYGPINESRNPLINPAALNPSVVNNTYRTNGVRDPLVVENPAVINNCPIGIPPDSNSINRIWTAGPANENVVITSVRNPIATSPNVSGQVVINNGYMNTGSRNPIAANDSEGLAFSRNPAIVGANGCLPIGTVNVNGVAVRDPAVVSIGLGTAITSSRVSAARTPINVNRSYGNKAAARAVVNITRGNAGKAASRYPLNVQRGYAGKAASRSAISINRIMGRW